MTFKHQFSVNNFSELFKVNWGARAAKYAAVSILLLQYYQMIKYVNKNKTINRQHSQECKNPRRHCDLEL